MRRWIKRWADWLRNDLFPLTRTRRGGHTIVIRSDAVDGTHHNLPIPWTAETVTVEIQLRLPPALRRKADLTLRFPGANPIPAESVRPELSERHRVVFRFPVPLATTVGELFWKSRGLIPITVPVLTAEAFLARLTITAPTVTARLGEQSVSARGYLPDGCKGLVAAAILRSPDLLGPVVDLGLSVEFRKERTGRTFTVAVPLSAEQRAATEAIVTATCPGVPRRPGTWTVGWWVGNVKMATRRLEVIPAGRFEDSVRVLDVRFAIADKAGAMRVVRQPPQPGTFERLGPCFVVANCVPGAVGLCRLSIFAIASGETSPVQLMDQEVLVTDVPTIFAPGLLGSEDLARVSGFELRLNGRVVGTTSLSPVPPAIITAEGGFKPPPDFAWTPAAEDELLDRLGKLDNAERGTRNAE